MWHDDSVFRIPSIVKCVDGSYLPFSLLSTLSCDNLCILIGKQLNRYPELVELQYHLDGNKQTVGAIQIWSDVDLKQFEQQMRQLIVSQQLCNGKISTHILKLIRVCFKYMIKDVVERKEVPQKKSTENRVCHTYRYCTSTLQPASALTAYSVSF